MLLVISLTRPAFIKVLRSILAAAKGPPAFIVPVASRLSEMSVLASRGRRVEDEDVRIYSHP